MTRARFTPGPWKVITGAAEGDPMRCAVVVERGKRQWLLATIENGAPEDFCETEEANAHLIAAAPSLFDGCNALLGLVALILSRDDVPKDIRDALETSHRIAEARAALELATGHNAPQQFHRQLEGQPHDQTD